jgi:hypothetical protein
MSGTDIDMRLFAKKAGTSLNFPAGSVVFNKGDPGECMYVVQSGVIEMVIGDRVVEVCGTNEAIGFMSVIDDAPRSSTARVKEACEVSVIDRRKFRFMIDEVPNFALYIMGAPHPWHGAGDVSLQRVARCSSPLCCGQCSMSAASRRNRSIDSRVVNPRG